ncbi:MAG: hypothetical protein Q8R30_05945 [bacterium]|nr:hypothetical protein [bacterium]MDZ4285985.1 hypothetical protein [Candidatus Sungbacteria bacterium]
MSKRIPHNVQELQKEIFILRSAVIGLIGKDEEGTYQPKFIEEILTASAETPQYRFGSKKSFLSDLARI